MTLILHLTSPLFVVVVMRKILHPYNELVKILQDTLAYI